MAQATLVLPVLALYMVQIFLQEVPRYGFDIKGIVGNRGHPPELGVFTARLERARNHPMAALPLLLVPGWDERCVFRDHEADTDGSHQLRIREVDHDVPD